MAGTTSLIISNLLSSLERLSRFMPMFISLGASSSSSIAQEEVTVAEVYSIEKRLMEDLSRLSRMLQRIQAALYDVEEREVTEKAIQLWLSELREVAYDTEDILDQYDYQVIKTQFEGMTVVVEAEPSLKGKRVDDNDDDVYGYQLVNCNRLEPASDEDFDHSFGRVSFEEGFARVIECPGMREWCQWHGFTYRDKDRTALMAMLEDWESDDSSSEEVSFDSASDKSNEIQCQLQSRFDDFSWKRILMTTFDEDFDDNHVYKLESNDNTSDKDYDDIVGYND